MQKVNAQAVLHAIQRTAASSQYGNDMTMSLLLLDTAEQDFVPVSLTFAHSDPGLCKEPALSFGRKADNPTVAVTWNRRRRCAVTAVTKYVRVSWGASRM